MIVLVLYDMSTWTTIWRPSAWASIDLLPSGLNVVHQRSCFLITSHYMFPTSYYNVHYNNDKVFMSLFCCNVMLCWAMSAVLSGFLISDWGQIDKNQSLRSECIVEPRPWQCDMCLFIWLSGINPSQNKRQYSELRNQNFPYLTIRIL